MLLLFFRRRVFLGVNGTNWMDVEDVRMDAADALRAVNINADVEEQREDRQLVGDEDGLRAAEQIVALGRVGGGISQADEAVVLVAGPAGTVVAVLGHEQVEEGVGVVVVADPTATGEVVVERALLG